ncbi:MAG: COPII subunit [Alyxoria varia]|nr:MAG: COPII subunit [Alyxoria varia]
MADGQGGYQYQQDPNAEQPVAGDEPNSPTQEARPGPGRKKGGRAYATQAFDYGSGANSGLGNQPPAGYPPQPAASPQGNYPQAQPQQQQGYPQPSYGQPAYGQPAHGDQGYPQPGAQGGYSPQAGYGGMEEKFSSMNVNDQNQYRQTAQLNRLQTSDLISQPFHVSEIDRPPPPIVLPPNSSVTPSADANCPPKYVRSTLNAVPTTHSLLKKSRLPFGLVIQPYTSLHDIEDPVHVVPDQVISRCRRCRSYINPFVSFLDHGHRWRCNMCNLTNDVPQAFDWDATTQKSMDRWQRPELNCSVVEFVAPQEYMVRPPQPLVYLFLFDVSHASVANGLLATSARCILESLDRIPNADRRTRVGFIAVDSSLHYFSIQQDRRGEETHEEVSDPSMLVVSDLDEPFMPTPEDLLVTLSECRRNIEHFLNKLQSMFQSSQNTQSCMGAALRAGHKLIAPVGGKITVLTSTLPNTGAGKLEVRETKQNMGGSKESALLQTGNSFYKSFAVECSKNQVSIDMFLFSSHYQDVASLSNLPRYTGGQTYFYPNWNAARSEDAIKFAREFSDYLSAEIGLEAVLRVRATTGLRMSTFYGNFFNRSSDLCAFPAFPRDQAYVVEVAIDENITKPFVCMQTAVLHTTCNGERRIRVLTLALPTTQNLGDLYASADQHAITAYFSHKAVEKALGNGLEAARDALQSKFVELLSTYRKELAGSNVGGGLQFPVNLRALPVLFLGLIKNLGFRPSTQIPTDLRSAALCLLSTLPLPLMAQYIYPRLYSLHDMPDECGLPSEATGEIVMPPLLNLSSENLIPYGLYLLDDGQTQFLWVGRDAVPALVMDVFGMQDKTQLRQGKTTLPIVSDSDFNERVRNVVEKSRDRTGMAVGSVVVPSLYVIREDGEPQMRLWALTLMVEDRAEGGMMSLGQWMGGVREKVSSAAASPNVFSSFSFNGLAPD